MGRVSRSVSPHSHFKMIYPSCVQDGSVLLVSVYWWICGGSVGLGIVSVGSVGFGSVGFVSIGFVSELGGVVVDVSGGAVVCDSDGTVVCVSGGKVLLSPVDGVICVVPGIVVEGGVDPGGPSVTGAHATTHKISVIIANKIASFFIRLLS